MSDAITQTEITPNAGPADERVDRKRRTAVLVVHGMGSQRALDTVRGVINAVWLDKDGEPDEHDKRYWHHPERKGRDLDLSVLTTNEVPGTDDRRSVDFHELYWAHLMSETRAVAVLLWLFELVRKGPRLKRGMGALWWGATIFLCLLVQSVVLLVVHAVLLFLGNPPLINNKVQFGTINLGTIKESIELNLFNHPYHEPEALLLAPFFVLFMAAFYAAFFSAIRGAFRIAIYAGALALLTAVIFYAGTNDKYDLHQVVVSFTIRFLAISVSLCVAAIAMGRWGAIAMLATYLLSSCFFILYLNARYLINWDHNDTFRDIFLTTHDSNWSPFSVVWENSWIFWSLSERYSAVIAVAIISVYCALYALFLQPFLGDAARYFRPSPANVLVRREIRKQAVDMLHTLHEWGTYDRIIVVAHSLGTVVAYDMLRAYFSRVNNSLPRPDILEPEFSELDQHDRNSSFGTIKTKDEFREKGRELIRKIAAETVNSPNASKRKQPTWLVTDFITLGSPLTHAQYLMCDGNTEEKLTDDFHRRVKQREFPTCPPDKQAGDGLLSFWNPDTRKREFHHAALFGLTRWTNLFFPMYQLFWGDAVGGPLRSVFGRYIIDIPVSTANSGKPSFFTHTSYWKTTGPMGRGSPQIRALKRAINLNDR